MNTELDTEFQTVNDLSWVRNRQTNRLVLLVKEPTILFTYWEISDWRKKLLIQHFRMDWQLIPMFIRVHDITDIIFDGSNAHWTQNIRVNNHADNWYIHGVKPGRNYLVDLAVAINDQDHFTLLRSNTASTPPVYNLTQPKPTQQFCTPAFKVKNYSWPVQESVVKDGWQRQFTGYNLVMLKGGEQD